MKLPLPEAVFDQHIIVLGKTRSGKSSAMRVMVEHLLDAGKPVCVVDPKGDWWGLKGSESSRASYPVIIFGGEHADVPINSHSGASIAELVSTGNRSAIVDLGGWMPGERTTFWIEFASTYFRTHKGRHHLVIDEVHNFCPKGKIMDPNAGKMLHWANRLASEGLGKGIALLAASQRPQKVHNDFLTSCETLVAMRVIHKADRDALKDWVDACGDPDKGKEVLNTVAANKRGEAWVYSPECGFGPEKIQFPMFWTYDSFRPRPESDTKKITWADVDLNDVKTKLANVVKDAEAKDPVKLQARIRELEKALSARDTSKHQPSSKTPPAVKVAESEIRRVLRDQVEPWRLLAQNLRRRLVQAQDLIAKGYETIQVWGEIPDYPKDGLDTKKVQAQLTEPNFRQKPVQNSRPVPPSARYLPGDMPNIIHHPLPSPQMKILVALLELESIGSNQPSKEQTAAWAGYSPESGGFNNPMGRLKAEGLVTYPQHGYVALTPQGRGVGGGSMPRPDQEEVQRRVLAHCSGPERRILSALLENAGQGEMSAEDLADKAGYEFSSGGYNNPKGRLRTKGLIQYPSPGRIRASDWLFFE